LRYMYCSPDSMVLDWVRERATGQPFATALSELWQRIGAEHPAVVGLDGVSRVQDVHKLLEPIYNTISRLKWGGFATAIVLVIAALLLVANTIRLAAFARRREIGIMRLVGASTMYIALPFLLEALVTAVVGVALAALALWGFMEFVVKKQLSHDLSFIPWVTNHDYLLALGWIVILGPVLTIVPTLVLTRKYLKV